MIRVSKGFKKLKYSKEDDEFSQYIDVSSNSSSNLLSGFESLVLNVENENEHQAIILEVQPNLG